MAGPDRRQEAHEAPATQRRPSARTTKHLLQRMARRRADTEAHEAPVTRVESDPPGMRAGVCGTGIAGPRRLSNRGEDAPAFGPA